MTKVTLESTLKVVAIREALDALFADDPNVFVASDLNWYPVKGNPKVRIAPGLMVVFGRPKVERGSYHQFNEVNIPPQVVFEVLPASWSVGEMIDRFVFYQKQGVEEYYVYDSSYSEFNGWIRPQGEFELKQIDFTEAFVSPRLGFQFVGETSGLGYRPGNDMRR
jgi:Uma2 family endonuclease